MFWESSMFRKHAGAKWRMGRRAPFSQSDEDTYWICYLPWVYFKFVFAKQQCGTKDLGPIFTSTMLFKFSRTTWNIQQKTMLQKQRNNKTMAKKTTGYIHTVVKSASVWNQRPFWHHHINVFMPLYHSAWIWWIQKAKTKVQPCNIMEEAGSCSCTGYIRG